MKEITIWNKKVQTVVVDNVSEMYKSWIYKKRYPKKCIPINHWKTKKHISNYDWNVIKRFLS